jgi:ribosome-associated toxin RatA of RatAB toxin-antitoxin module
MPLSRDRRARAGVLRRADRRRAPPELAAGGALRSDYLGGDFRDFAGEWRFAPLEANRTRVDLDLRIDPGRLVAGPIRSAISDAVMRRALDDLKAHVERRPAAAGG